MAGSNAAVVVFTIGAVALWVYALAWALRHPKHPWYHTWLLVLLTLFWYIGESLAIRLGKYDYPPFPEALRLYLPFIGGTPLKPGVLETVLWKLVPADEGPPFVFDGSCRAESYGIPLPVVAIEAALVFGFFRLATRLLKVNNGRLRTSIATGGLCAVLMVNLFAVLDPVVSTHMWCQPGAMDPAGGFQHLPFPLWRWFTTTTHPSYWFGVPVINYVAWFVAAAVFGTLARYDDQRSDLLIRKYKIWLRYVGATLIILAFYLLATMVLLFGVNFAVTHGQDWIFPGHALFTQRTWQFGIIAALLGLALYFCWLGRRSRSTTEIVATGPLAFGLLYSLWLLLSSFHIWIFVVWFVTVAVAAIVIRWHLVGQRVFGDEEPLVQPAKVQRSGGRLVP